MNLELKLIYNDLCYDLSNHLGKELTVNEDNRVFIDVMRFMYGLYPLPQMGGSWIGRKPNKRKLSKRS